MLNSNLKKLITHAANIICLFEKDHSSSYIISPYMSPELEGSETVALILNTCVEKGLDSVFIEPLVDYCKSNNITWKISSQKKNQFIIDLT